MRCIRLVAVLLLHAILTNVVRPVYGHKGALFTSTLIISRVLQLRIAIKHNIYFALILFDINLWKIVVITLFT